MNVMITLESFTSHSSLAIRCGDIQEIGNLAFSQLAELRHRGAFSTVSQTFVACCKICVKAESWYPQQEDKSIQTLPQEWYQVCLDYFNVAKPINRL